MKVTHVFMAIAAADHAAAVGWYERFLGAGRAAVTIAVRDLDELLGDLRERGIAATIVMDAGMRTAVAVDPDGNRIKFFEDPEPESLRCVFDTNQRVELLATL
jgi:hypothetical protein